MSNEQRIYDRCIVRVGQLEAENEQLRNEFRKMDEWHSKELVAAMDENAKLRELAERAWKAAEMLCQAFDGQCRDDGVTIAKLCPLGERDEECVYGQLQRDLREMGIEVDE
jgi:hypothetical protein